MLLPKLRARIVVAPWVVPRKNVIQGVAQKNCLWIVQGICWGKVACLTHGDGGGGGGFKIPYFCGKDSIFSNVFFRWNHQLAWMLGERRFFLEIYFHPDNLDQLVDVACEQSRIQSQNYLKNVCINFLRHGNLGKHTTQWPREQWVFFQFFRAEGLIALQDKNHLQLQNIFPKKWLLSTFFLQIHPAFLSSIWNWNGV